MKDLKLELGKIKNKTALVVFPHPDDESVMAGGLIKWLVASSWKVVVVCLTCGERGRVHINGLGRSVAEIRKSEFVAAMEVLGVFRFELFNFSDGELRRRRRWQRVLSEIIDGFQPGLIVSYDPSGVTGHPDHVALAVWLLDMLRKRKWKTRLLWPVIFGEAKKLITDERVSDLLPDPKYRLDLSVEEVVRKWRAISVHRSQGWARIRAVWLMCLGWLLRYRREEYAEADLAARYEHRYVKFKF